MNTLDPMLPPPEDPGSHRPRRSVIIAVLGVVALLGAVGIGAAAVIPRPFCAFAPGSARPTESALRAGPNETTYPSEGELYFTTVSVRSLTLLEEFRANRDNTIEVVTEEQGRCRSSAARAENRVSMSTSIQTAVRLALTELGYELDTQGAQITGLDLDSPVGQVLNIGEGIVGVDGTATLNGEALRQAIDRPAHVPGDEVELQLVDPAGENPRTQRVTLVDSCAGIEVPEGQTCPSRTIIGVNIQDFVPELPVDIDIESGDVGGPSAGLAFTLAIIDYLTPGELTGGKQIAVTGTIDAFGNVGRVGGVAQKTTASRRNGAEVFIVPSDELEEAKEFAGSNMEVVAADTIGEALAVLDSLGGSGVERAALDPED